MRALATGAPLDLRVVFVDEFVFVFMFISVVGSGGAVVIGAAVDVISSVVVIAGVVVTISVVAMIGVVVQGHQHGHIAGVSVSPSVVEAVDSPIESLSVILTDLSAAKSNPT